MLPQANKWKAERSRSEPTMSEKPLKEQLTECKNACHGLAVDKAVLQMKDSRLEATITSLQAEVERLQGYADSADAVADGLRIENAALKKENERLREFARWVGDNYHVTDWPFASINANAVREKLDVLLTGGE